LTNEGKLRPNDEDPAARLLDRKRRWLSIDDKQFFEGLEAVSVLESRIVGSSGGL